MTVSCDMRDVADVRFFDHRQRIVEPALVLSYYHAVAPKAGGAHNRGKGMPMIAGTIAAVPGRARRVHADGS
jgi:hypothetical protein